MFASRNCGLSRKNITTSFRGFKCVDQQHGNGHGADTARHRRNVARHFFHRRKVDIAAQLTLGRSVHADVDDDRTGLDHLGCQDVAPANRSDHDVGLARVVADIGRRAVTDGDRRIGLQQQQGHRLAHRVAASNDHRVLAAQIDAGGLYQFHAAIRRAGSKTRCAGHQFASAEGRITVHILAD